MQIKSNLRYNLTLVRVGFIKSKRNKSDDENGERATQEHYWQESKLVLALYIIDKNTLKLSNRLCFNYSTSGFFQQYN